MPKFHFINTLNVWKTFLKFCWGFFFKKFNWSYQEEQKATTTMHLGRRDLYSIGCAKNYKMMACIKIIIRIKMKKSSQNITHKVTFIYYFVTQAFANSENFRVLYFRIFFLQLEHKSHIFSRPCNVLLYYTV